MFKLTVAELADTDLEDSAEVDRAIKVTSFDRLQHNYFDVDDTIRDAEQGSLAE